MKYFNLIHIATLLFFVTGTLYSQDKTSKVLGYQWEEHPVLHTLDARDAESMEILLKDNRIIECLYNEDGNLINYLLRHKIIRVNSDDAIEANNRIYLPFGSSTEMIRQMARVINSQGKVVELGDSDIKEAVDEESSKTYRYFALEGLDKGSEIEYFFVMKVPLLYTGATEIFQSEIPRYNINFEIISPRNLVFAAKSYNGFPELEKDTTDSGNNWLHTSVDYIEGIKDEDYANHDASMQMVVYKLMINTYKGRKELYTYGNAAEILYNGIYANMDKGVKKSVLKFIKAAKDESSQPIEKRVRNLEDYVKGQINIVDASADALKDVSQILKNKAADDRGMVNLFAYIFTALDINHYLLMTSNRFDHRFDPDFNAYNFLQEYLFYFPGPDKYMVPGAPLSRIGYPTFGLTATDAMMLKPVEVGDYKTAVAKMVYIKPTEEKANFDNIYADVHFDDDISDPDIHIKLEQMGYPAQVNQALYDYLDDEKKDEATDDLVKFISEDTEVEDKSISNEGIANYGLNPLIAEADIKLGSLVESGGNKYLFKIGMLIGPQAEMYRDDERHLDIENVYNHGYHRVISFNIPEGYQCTNLDKLNIDVSLIKDDEKIMYFESGYKMEGNKVTVIIDEHYKKILLPKSDYESYRKIINAAADFNKIVLIFATGG